MHNRVSNNLFKQRTVYENDAVRIGTRPVMSGETKTWKLIGVVRKGKLADINEEKEDVQYWLSRPPKERMEAVTFLVRQSCSPGERMDKSVVYKGRRK